MPQISHRLRAMVGRDPAEPHRAATSLELLFDLAFVAGFGIAGSQMAHLLAEGHVAVAIGGFAFAMVAIIWAWINFTWFASAFDTDDWFYRVTTMVQMCGVVVLALGLSDMFASLDAHEGIDNRMMVAGYVVMRVALVVQWLRAARQSPQYRPAALTYAGFVGAAQIGWVIFSIPHLPLGWTIAASLLLYAVEFAGPAVAELRMGGTPWHAHHVAERYGCLALIGLGEGVLGTIAAVQPIVDDHGWTVDAVILVAAGIVLTFGLWWSFFAVPFGEALHRRRSSSSVFGYGLLPLFAATAAVGAGLHVAAYLVEGTAAIAVAAAVEAVAMPVLVFLVTLFTVYALMVRRMDGFHAIMLAVCVVILVSAVLLAGAGVGFAVCVSIVCLAPVAVVVGYEVEGHRHVTADLDVLAG